MNRRASHGRGRLTLACKHGQPSTEHRAGGTLQVETRALQKVRGSQGLAMISPSSWPKPQTRMEVWREAGE